MEYEEIVSALEQGKTFEAMTEMATPLAKTLQGQVKDCGIAMLRDDVYAFVDDAGKPQALAVLHTQVNGGFEMPYGLGKAFASSPVDIPILVVTAATRPGNVREVIENKTEGDFEKAIKMLRGVAESCPSKIVLVSPPLYQDNDYFPRGYSTVVMTDTLSRTYQVAYIPLDTANRHTARKKLNQIKQVMAIAAKVYEPKNEVKFGRQAFKCWPHIFSGKEWSNTRPEELFDHLCREMAATYTQIVNDMAPKPIASLH